MSVDDRLRRGMEANALAFLPEGEARLAQVRTRNRRRLTGIGACVLAGAAVSAIVVGTTLAGGEGRSVPYPALPPSSPIAEIPDSTWTRVITNEEARELGVSEGARRKHLGTDGLLPVTLDFLDGFYDILVTSDSGVVESGDDGTYEFDDQGRLVTTSYTPGCPYCTTVVEWRIDGNLLVTEAPDSRLTPVERMMTEGTWERSEP